MAGMDPKIDLPTYSMFNERASYGFEATTTSAGMVSAHSATVRLIWDPTTMRSVRR